jgi:hypothetical protein
MVMAKYFHKKNGDDNLSILEYYNSLNIENEEGLYTTL